jgi:hypothetical protein
VDLNHSFGILVNPAKNAKPSVKYYETYLSGINLPITAGVLDAFLESWKKVFSIAGFLPPRSSPPQVLRLVIYDWARLLHTAS